MTCPWKSIRPATEISGSTASQQSFSRALSWLDRCEADHKMCKSSRSNLLLDRVLDLGTSSDPNDLSPISLYEAFDVKLNFAKYACLSHCWGRVHHITTSSSTIKDRKAGIEWNDLPKTFQDAMTFTRRLGIRHLWIDLLCIVQDDPNDWSVQSSKMPLIYENAYVTLAATFSPSSTGGCFSEGGSEFRARDFTVRDRSRKPHQIFIRRHLPHWLMADPRQLRELDQDFPLLQRAWVLQERLLSPRVLHFGRHELMWECMKSRPVNVRSSTILNLKISTRSCTIEVLFREIKAVPPWARNGMPWSART
jgi:hypothetical protein